MIIEFILIGMMMSLLMAQSEYVLYEITDDGEMRGITAEEATERKMPRGTWDVTNEDYQQMMDAIDKSIEHCRNWILPAAKMKLTELDRNMHQHITVYKATLIAITDYLKRSEENAWIPNDYDGEDWIEDMKSLGRKGLLLMKQDWPIDESVSWWNEVKDYVPKLWI